MVVMGDNVLACLPTPPEDTSEHSVRLAVVVVVVVDHDRTVASEAPTHRAHIPWAMLVACRDVPAADDADDDEIVVLPPPSSWPAPWPP